jgi:phytoene dehydrogenase-like protein
MKKIVIIGSGMGGLTAGNLLVQNGHEVVLFEAQRTPGGYTGGFRRDGFYFESGTLAFESSDQVFRAMKRIGVFAKVDFVRQKMHIISGEMNGVCSSYEEFRSLAYASFPAEKARLDRYFGEADRMIRAMNGVMAPRGIAGALAYPLRLAQFMYLFRKFSKTTVTDFTAECFGENTPLQRRFKDLGYPDMSAALIGPALTSFLDDYWTVRTGFQSWADALADTFRARGGELKLGVRVDKIVTRNGAAVGVEAGGQSYPADWVVSAADYKRTFLQWLDDRSLLPPEFAKKVADTAVSEGIVTAYLGLSIPPAELGKSIKAPHASYRDPGSEADFRHGADDPDYFKKAGAGLYSPSLHDAGLAPEGKSGLMVQAVAPTHWMNNWGGGDRQRYRELKEGVKRDLIAKAAAVVPGLESRIEYSDLATPLTYERYTGNTDGATSAWSWNPHNKFYKSPMKVHIDTPVKNLLIGSCWSVQIGGVPSAINAARLCARRIGS